jgi:hypothetical protein
MFLERCSLYQGQAATATNLKTGPAMIGLEVKTGTPSKPPPPPSRRHLSHRTPFGLRQIKQAAKPHTQRYPVHPEGSVQKKISDPSPTLLVTCSSNHLSPSSPPSLMRAISLHHADPCRPPSRSLPPPHIRQPTL